MNYEEKLKEINDINRAIELTNDFIPLKLIEEMSELTKAILKKDNENALEESVDVYIMLKQYINTYFNSEDFNKIYHYKIDRTLNRIKNK